MAKRALQVGARTHSGGSGPAGGAAAVCRGSGMGDGGLPGVTCRTDGAGYEQGTPDGLKKVAAGVATVRVRTTVMQGQPGDEGGTGERAPCLGSGEPALPEATVTAGVTSRTSQTSANGGGTLGGNRLGIGSDRQPAKASVGKKVTYTTPPLPLE